MNGRNQFFTLLAVIFRPLFSAKTAADSFCGGKLYAHKAVQVNIGGGKLRSSKGGRVVVHANHNIVAPDIKSAICTIVVFVIADKILLDSLKKSFRPKVVPDVIANQANLAAQERLMHIHQNPFLMLHVQIGLRPVGYLNHHGNIAVLKLMVEKISDIALSVLNQPLPHPCRAFGALADTLSCRAASPGGAAFVRAVRILIRQIQKSVNRPESIPVPHVPVVD